MIVDTSALVAIAKDEPENDRFSQLIAASTFCRISAATLLEVGIVIDGRWGSKLSYLLDVFLQEAGIIVEPVTESQAQRARRAYMIYGKGSGHPAKLNFGDCFSYALAREMDEPLLFRGDDFGQTDVRIAAK